MLRLVYLVFFDDKRFKEEERHHDSIIHKTSEPTNTDRAHQIRQGLLHSLIQMLGSIAAGLFVGTLLLQAVAAPETIGTAFLILGAAVLLWATFAVQGWSVQSFKGTSLGERVNRCIFRTLYVAGTILIAAGTILTV